MLSPFIKSRLPRIKRILSDHRILSAWVFGSGCREDFNDQSDIDLLVRFDEKLEPLEKGELWWSALYALEEELGRKVDLVTENSLTNPYFIAELNDTKVNIHGPQA